MTPICNQILKFSVLYTSKIHNKNPANQDGVLFYHTQNWRLRLFECDRHGNMGMEIALDFRKMDHLKEGEVFILAGKYRVMVDSLLSTEIVTVGLPPPAVEGAAAATVTRQRQRDSEDGSKRKRSGLRPGELAHGQTDRALKDVIREQNENMKQQRRQQRRAGNRQWTSTTAAAATTRSSSSIGSWQQQLQQLMLQQQQEQQKNHQNHSRQEQQSPRKKPDHSQNRDKKSIASTQPLLEQHHLHQEAPQQTLPRSNHRSAVSVNTAAIAMLDAALDDDQDDAIFFSDLDDMPGLSSDGEIEVLDVTHPGNKPNEREQLSVTSQHVAPISFPTAINTNNELHIPINVRSSKKSQSPKKLAAKSPTKTATAVMKSVFLASNKSSMVTSPISLRPPSFANSNFSNGAFGSIPSGGGLRCLQGMLSRTPMSRLPPATSVVGTNIIDRKNRHAKSANDNDNETEDFRTISTKILADLNQVEANLNLSIQKNSINVINNKEKVHKTFKSDRKNNSVTEVKTSGDKTVGSEINTSPTRASESTMTTTLDYSDKIIDDIDFFSDSDPVFIAEPVLSVDNPNDNNGQHVVGLNNTPTLLQQQNSLQKIKSDNKDEFDDYDFTDDADMDMDLLSYAHQKTTPDTKPVTAATKVEENGIEMVVNKDEQNIKIKDVKMAGNDGDLFDSQEELDIPDEFFEDDDKSNNNLLSCSPSLAAATEILHSSAGENNTNGDDNVVMTEDHNVLAADAETSSIVEIQLLSLPSQPASSAAVSTMGGTSGTKSPGQDGRDDSNSATIISSCAIPVSTTTNTNTALLDVVSLTNKNTTTPPLDTTNINTNNTGNRNNSFSRSLSCDLSSPHDSKTLCSVPHADLQHKTESALSLASNSANNSKLSSSPVSVTKATATTVTESTASCTSTFAQSSPSVLLHTGFGRPRKRAMLGICSDSMATGLTTTLSTNNVITTAAAGDGVVNRNNPQFVPPVSKAHLQQQQQQQRRQQQRVYTTPNNRSNATSSTNTNNNSSSLVPRIEPVVLVAEEYGAWTAETMDLFSWRPAQ